MINNWIFWSIMYIIFFVVFNQMYKVSTKSLKKPGALTVVVQVIGALFILLFTPLFEMKFADNIYTYIIFFIALCCYSISDRLNTTVRENIEASTYSMIRQISTVFLIITGILFFREEFVLSKIIGSILIIFSNVLVFYDKNIKFNKYFLLGVLSTLVYTVALFLDVNISSEFNLPIYVFISLFVPAIIIFIFDKIDFKDVINEFKKGNKKAILITSISWPIGIFSMLKAYNLGEVSIVAPILSLTVICNVIVGYIFLKERSNLFKKLLAAICIIVSVILIKS